MKNIFLKRKMEPLKSIDYGSASKEEGFKLKDLGYDYNSLEPYIDEETVKIHHDKHQKAYVDNLNKALINHKELYKKTLEEILSDLESTPEDIRLSIINQGGGVYNHEFYWSILGKGKNKPSKEMEDVLNRDFGSFNNFKEKFKECGLKTFGSGWAWLVCNKEGKLEIISTKDQATPISQGLKPILTMDLWEHAYYLKYQNKRAEYIDNFFNIINWEQCEKYYKDK